MLVDPGESCRSPSRGDVAGAAQDVERLYVRDASDSRRSIGRGGAAAELRRSSKAVDDAREIVLELALSVPGGVARAWCVTLAPEEEDEGDELEARGAICALLNVEVGEGDLAGFFLISWRRLTMQG